MARKGEKSYDFRSEAERIRPRVAKALFKDEPESKPGAIGHIEHGTYRQTHFEHNLSADRKLLEQVIHALSSDPDLSTSDITVEVRDSSVALTGAVDTMNSKYRAEEMVRRFEEVARIENHLTVRLGDALDEFTRGADASRLREEVTRTTKRY